MSNTLEMTSSSADETRSIGVRLGQSVQAGDVVLLSGDLGAGKTTLTQGIAQGLGVPERPRSPTFVMAAEYHGRLPLYHLDLYRVDQTAELGELGLEEYLSGEGVTVVEWADKAPQSFPPEHLWITLEAMSQDARRVTMRGEGPRHEALVNAVRSRPSPAGKR